MTVEEALDLTTIKLVELQKMHETTIEELRETIDAMLRLDGECRRQRDVIDNMHECNVQLFNEKARLARENEALRRDLRVMGDIIRAGEG